MNKLHPYLIIAILMALTSSCANYKLNYSDRGKEWQQNSPPTNKKLSHRMYLIGDGGNAPRGGTTNVLQHLSLIHI